MVLCKEDLITHFQTRLGHRHVRTKYDGVGRLMLCYCVTLHTTQLFSICVNYFYSYAYSYSKFLQLHTYIYSIYVSVRVQ